MKTEYVKIEKKAPDMYTIRAIRRAGEIIKAGGLVAFPTETVYGLGGNALDEKASSKIYEAKGRPSDNPLIVHICDLADLYKIADGVTDKAMAAAKKFWPGPLTMIFRKKEIVPYSTTGGLDTVAVRFPSNPVAEAFIRESGGFIAAPSANLSGRPSPVTAEQVRQDLDGRIDMVLDGGQVGIGLESTIIDMTGEIPELLRPGYITSDMLMEVFPEVARDPSLDRKSLMNDADTPAPRAPGMKYRHYAPKGELILVEGIAENVAAYITDGIREAKEEGRKCAVICSDESAQMYFEDCGADVLFRSGSRDDREQMAASLFSILRACDDNGADIIYAETVSDDGIGDAIMNRLRKAAGYRIADADHIVKDNG